MSQTPAPTIQAIRMTPMEDQTIAEERRGLVFKAAMAKMEAIPARLTTIKIGVTIRKVCDSVNPEEDKRTTRKADAESKAHTPPIIPAFNNTSINVTVDDLSFDINITPIDNR